VAPTKDRTGVGAVCSGCIQDETRPKAPTRIDELVPTLSKKKFHLFCGDSTLALTCRVKSRFEQARISKMCDCRQNVVTVWRYECEHSEPGEID
jgi:hypothetical protein